MIRKALVADTQVIHELINSWAQKGALLKRSLNYIYENIRDFWVFEQNNKIIGCCSLHIVGWDNLGEIKSLVVSSKHQRKGIGKLLVEKCLDEALSLGLAKVFALTFVGKFFKKLGFKRVSMKKLPHKIWSDCVECVYFPDCKEEAVILKIERRKPNVSC